jgi:AraC family transcriptional regulator, transcriptional activator of pobA
MEYKQYHSNFVSGLMINETFGRYRISCKAGVYCVFGVEQISNQRHAHDCYELCVITSGSGKYIHDDREYLINKGDVIIADPGIAHEIQCTNTQDMRLLYIFIDISENKPLTMVKSIEDKLIHGFKSGHSALAPSKTYILSYLDFIESYGIRRGNRNFGTYNALKQLVLESLAVLSYETSILNNGIITQNAFERALDYIDENLHKKILVRDIALETHISQRNLEYIFRKNLGKTVKEYICEKKIDLACHYLSMYFTVSDTGRLVGIPDLTQFSRLFKKYKGMPPTQYQKTMVTCKNGMGRRI